MKCYAMNEHDLYWEAIMKRYKKYKDSGIEWIGEIPDPWDVKKLKYIVKINNETLSNKIDGQTEIRY